MASAEGAVRARHMKSLLATADRLPPSDASAVRARIAPPILQSIVDATGPEWMPLVVNEAFTRAVHDALVPGRFEAFFRAHLLESFRSPLLRALVDGGMALFGLDPGSYLRVVPRGWDAIFRSCGAWSKPRAVAAGRAEIALEDLPSELVVDDVWPRSVAASLSALTDLARTRGDMRLVALDRRAARASYALRWGPGAADAPAA